MWKDESSEIKIEKWRNSVQKSLYFEHCYVSNYLLSLPLLLLLMMIYEY